MNQDQQVEDDLQKAINDITNSTNKDPVFNDPVAAPSSIPEDDTGELAEPVGPFPAPKVEVVQATEQMAPIEPLTIPDLPMPPAEPEPATPTPVAEPAPAPAPEPTPAPAPEPIPAPAPAPAPEPIPAPIVTEATATIEEVSVPTNLNMNQVKKAALRDLVPLVDHLSMNASQRFHLYRNIFEDLSDYTVLEPAYRAASEIADEHERAEALLYLIESIDKM